MAMDAKVSFMEQIERSCSDKLTVKDMSVLLNIVSDILENFDMRETFNRTNDNEKDDLLESFVSSLQIQNRSQKTIERYRYIIKRFMSYVNIHTRKVNVYHIRNWLSTEKNRGVADSTLESCRQVLSSYFGWLHRESLVEKNPIVNVGTIKIPKKQKLIFGDDDIEKMIRCCNNPRERAIIHFLRSTGCRVSEMTSLNRDAVDFGSQECIVHGKGDKERFVYLDSLATMALREYFMSRTDDNEALFINRFKERIHPGGIRCILKDIGKAAGVPHVHPHKFRRTLATEMTRRGMSIQDAANILGHEKLDTTMKYIVLNKDNVKSSYRKYA